MQPLYDASMIEVLTLREAIRKRPRMWLRSNDHQLLHHLLSSLVEGLLWRYRVLGHSLNQITIRLEQDGSATITSEGATLPAAFLEQSAQVVKRDFQVYVNDLHLLVVVNALCERLCMHVHGSNTYHPFFFFEQGILRSEESRSSPPDDEHDIWLRLWPDFTILDPEAFDNGRTQERMRSFSGDYPESTITIIDTCLSTD
jgi:DNA gyrase/topoisomerase IV subunit B